MTDSTTEEPRRAAEDRQAELKARPTALYRLYDQAGSLLYVGITCNLDERFKDHRNDKKKPWWPQVADKTVRWYDNRDAAEEAERYAIAMEDPLHNVVWAGPDARLTYQEHWIFARLREEEKAIRTPYRTPRSKRGKAELADVLERQAVAHGHMPTRTWWWDGQAIHRTYVDERPPQELRAFMEWRKTRPPKRVPIDTSRWSGCRPWPAECITLETRRIRGECPTCAGVLFPCPVVMEMAGRWREHPLYCF